MIKKEYKRIKLLMHDIKKRQDKLNSKENFINIMKLSIYDKKNLINMMNLSICIEDLLKVLLLILNKSSEKEGK